MGKFGIIVEWLVLLLQILRNKRGRSNDYLTALFGSYNKILNVSYISLKAYEEAANLCVKAAKSPVFRDFNLCVGECVD